MICENVVSVRTPLAAIYSVLIERLGIYKEAAHWAEKRKIRQIVYQAVSGPAHIHSSMHPIHGHTRGIYFILIFLNTHITQHITYVMKLNVNASYDVYLIVLHSNRFAVIEKTYIQPERQADR